jgi:hypothetical protein
MDELKWPAAPSCHKLNRIYSSPDSAWRAPWPDDGGPYAYTYRTCNYCGSMHPEDLAKALEAGAEIDMADWKYGWPHKFYVMVPNPKAGQECRIGSSGQENTPIMGKAPATVHAKWYNEHMAEMEPAAFERVSNLIFARTAIKFSMVGGRLMFQCLPRNS